MSKCVTDWTEQEACEAEAEMRFTEERLDGTPCGRTECPFHDSAYQQSCGVTAGYGDGPYLPICKHYRPSKGGEA